jgi:hypothetical protein
LCFNRSSAFSALVSANTPQLLISAFYTQYARARHAADAAVDTQALFLAIKVLLFL